MSVNELLADSVHTYNFAIVTTFVALPSCSATVNLVVCHCRSGVKDRNYAPAEESREKHCVGKEYCV